jgi:hypothetical protein
LLHSPDGAAITQTSMPWCAVNPWNDLLYTSENGDDAPMPVVRAYDRTASYTHRPTADIALGKAARHVQGGCFTPKGHLLLATDERDSNDPRFKLVRAYSAFNGFYYGAARVLAQEDNQELEDICYAPMVINDVHVQVHAVLLENIGPTVTPAGVLVPMDNIFFKHFKAPFVSTI